MKYRRFIFLLLWIKIRKLKHNIEIERRFNGTIFYKAMGKDCELLRKY